MTKFNWNDLTWDDPMRERAMRRAAKDPIPEEILDIGMNEIMLSDYKSVLYQRRFMADMLGKQIPGMLTDLILWERQTTFCPRDWGDLFADHMLLPTGGGGGH